MAQDSIELTHLTQVAQGSKHCMPGMQSMAIELTHLLRVAQDAKHCMAWDAIEGDQTHPFESGSAGCQALHGPGCNRRRSNSPVRTGCQAMHGHGVQSKAIDLTRLTRGEQDAKHFMALGAVKGNRTHPFASCSTECQTLHGIGCNCRQSNSPV